MRIKTGIRILKRYHERWLSPNGKSQKAWMLRMIVASYIRFDVGRSSVKARAAQSGIEKLTK